MGMLQAINKTSKMYRETENTSIRRMRCPWITNELIPTENDIND